MSRKIIAMNRFNGGIAIGDKEGNPSSYRFGYGVNIHDEPSKFSVLPKAVKVLGGTFGDVQTVGSSVMNAQMKWIVTGRPFTNAVYAVDSNGSIYQEDSSGNWTVLRQVSSCVGQGLGVYGDYLYYVRNTAIGRYGPLSGLPSFDDSWQSGLNDTSVTGWSPVLSFGKGIAFGHLASVAWYDGTTFTLARILLPPNAWCRSMCRIEQYLMIGTVGSRNVFDNEEGYVFAWDGASTQWNFFNNIEQGSNNCLANYRNQPFSVNGTLGVVYLGFDPFVKVHQLPKIPITSSVEVYPGAVSSWKGKTYVGFGANSDDPNFVRGVYSWGAKSNGYPDSLTCDFLVSTGNSGNTVQVTAVKGLGNALYVSWQDGTSYGVDKVTNSNPPQASARMDFLIFDDRRIPQDKSADTIRIDHSALRAGESVSIYARTDRTGDFTAPMVTHSYSADDLKPRETRYRIAPSMARFHEFEWGVSLGCSATTPEVYGVSFKYADLEEEEGI